MVMMMMMMMMMMLHYNRNQTLRKTTITERQPAIHAHKVLDFSFLLHVKYPLSYCRPSSLLYTMTITTIRLKFLMPVT